MNTESKSWNNFIESYRAMTHAERERALDNLSPEQRSYFDSLQDSMQLSIEEITPSANLADSSEGIAASKTARSFSDLDGAVSEISSESTRLLMAAAHLNVGSLHADLESREKNRFKADTEELYTNLSAIKDEVKKAKSREAIRRLLLLPFALWALLSIFSDSLEFIMPLAALVIIELIVDLQRHTYVRRHFLRSRFREKSGQPEQNLVISGGYSPFVGSGFDVSGWSFTVDLTVSPEGSHSEPENLDIQDLYSEMTEDLLALDIPSVSIFDQLFVHGKDIRGDREILPVTLGKPLPGVSAEYVARYVGANDPQVRHYKVLRIPAWGGQLVLSVFFRATKIGQSLFIESRFFLLPPLKEEFSKIDDLTTGITLSQFFGLLVLSAFKAPFTWVGSVFWVLSLFDLSPDQEKNLVKENEQYNYGWDNSLRESWAQTKYQRYFQSLDRDMYFKVLEQRMVNSIVRALERRGISTEAIKDRASTILNNGVVITGGEITAENFAVGKGAKAVAKKAFTAARGAGGTAAAKQQG